MKSPLCTVEEIASVLRLSTDEFHEVVKRHSDFPVADASGHYRRAEVFAFLNEKTKQGKTATLLRRHGHGSLN